MVGLFNLLVSKNSRASYHRGISTCTYLTWLWEYLLRDARKEGYQYDTSLLLLHSASFSDYFFAPFFLIIISYLQMSFFIVLLERVLSCIVP